MGTTTFSGAVRSEGGFEQVTKTASTGAITTNFDINSSGSLILSAGLSSPTGLVGSTNTSKSQLANGASGALTKNTIYLSPADGNAITVTLPTAANSTAGDVIIVEYQVGINNAQTHQYATSGEMFMAGSAVYKKTGATGSAVGLIDTVDVADGANDDFLKLIGLTNAGPGIGSYVIFSFNGTNWRAEARCTSSETGEAANLSAFAAT